MCESVEWVVDAVNCQTGVMEEFIGEVHRLKWVVEHLSSSSTSSLQGAASGVDAKEDSMGDKDVEMVEDKELGEDDERVVRQGVQ